MSSWGLRTCSRLFLNVPLPVFFSGSVQSVLPRSAFHCGQLCATAQSLLSSSFVDPLGYSLLAFLSVFGYAFTSLHPVPSTAVLFLVMAAAVAHPV